MAPDQPTLAGEAATAEAPEAGTKKQNQLVSWGEKVALVPEQLTKHHILSNFRLPVGANAPKYA